MARTSSAALALVCGLLAAAICLAQAAPNDSDAWKAPGLVVAKFSVAAPPSLPRLNLALTLEEEAQKGLAGAVATVTQISYAARSADESAPLPPAQIEMHLLPGASAAGGVMSAVALQQRAQLVLNSVLFHQQLARLGVRIVGGAVAVTPAWQVAAEDVAVRASRILEEGVRAAGALLAAPLTREQAAGAAEAAARAAADAADTARAAADTAAAAVLAAADSAARPAAAALALPRSASLRAAAATTTVPFDDYVDEEGYASDDAAIVANNDDGDDDDDEEEEEEEDEWYEEVDPTHYARSDDHNHLPLAAAADAEAAAAAALVLQPRELEPPLPPVQKQQQRVEEQASALIDRLEAAAWPAAAQPAVDVTQLVAAAVADERAWVARNAWVFCALLVANAALLATALAAVMRRNVDGGADLRQPLLGAPTQQQQLPV